jgi:hypothetical protein
VNEAQEAVNAKSGGYFGSVSTGGSFFGGGSSQSAAQTVPSSSNITQYHALGLLYLIRQQDRMAVTKMIQQLGGGKSGAGTTLKNAMALCMLIRYAAKVMEEDPKCVFYYRKKQLMHGTNSAQCTKADGRVARGLAASQERYGQLRGCPCHLRNEKCDGGAADEINSGDAALPVLTKTGP